MASNRGPNAVGAAAVDPSQATIVGVGLSASAGPPLTRSFSTATGVSEVASEDGSTSVRTAPSQGVAGSPKKPPQSRSPSRQSYYEEAVRSVLQPGQRALFFGKGTMGVVLKPTYLARLVPCLQERFPYDSLSTCDPRFRVVNESVTIAAILHKSILL